MAGIGSRLDVHIVIMKLPNAFYTFSLSLALLTSVECVRADILLSQDFAGGDGGFTATSNGNSTLPWVYNSASGVWSTDGEANGTPTNHYLTSPTVTVPTSHVVRVSVEHYYSFEGGNWDGGALQVSINGGSFDLVDANAFSQNGYTNTAPLIGEHDLTGEDAFNGNSPGAASGSFVSSVLDLEGISASDTIAVRFLAAFDQGSKGEFTPNWAINRVVIETLTDNDGDGMSNSFEELYDFLDPDDASDAELDEDNDGLENLEEFKRGTIPNDADSDDDGYADGVETETGTWVSAANTGTSPLIDDTDQDGLLDGVENPDLGYNANDPQNQPGTDPNKANTDGDFVPDATEIANGSDPTDPNDVPEILLFRYEFDTAAGPLVDTSGQNGPDLATPSNGPEHRFGEPSLVGGNGFSIGLDAPGDGHPTGSYLLVRDAVHPQTFSFSLWIKPENAGVANPLFSRENVWFPSPGSFYLLEVDASGGLLWKTGSTETIVTEPDLIADGEIYHIVVTYLDTDGPDTFEADRSRLYLNGVMLDEVENPTEIPSLEALMDANGIYESIWVGTRSSGPGYKGEMDDFQYYSAELTPEQVMEMYNNPGTTAPFGVGPTFEVTEVGFDAASRSVSLKWTSKANKSYAIEYSDAPGIFDWQELTDGVASEGETTTFVDENLPEGVTHRSYRILQQ